MQGTRVAVQGFGNVGSIAAQLMEELGLNVVAVSDKSGGIYNPKGLRIKEVQQHVKQHRYLSEYKEADHIANDQVLTLDCDVLVPAAMENVITSQNAREVKARVICEGANGPTTANADRILEEKGVFVIPDILANAGGVTVSYFEWVQDRGGYFWDEETVNQRLERIMVHSFDEVVAMADRHSVNTRIGAYMQAHRAGRGGAPAARDVRVSAMELFLLTVGKLRPSYREACDDYLRRLGRYLKVREVEVREASRAPSVTAQRAEEGERCWPGGRRARGWSRSRARARRGAARSWPGSWSGGSRRRGRWPSRSAAPAGSPPTCCGGRRAGAWARSRCRTSWLAWSWSSSCTAPAPSSVESRITRAPVSAHDGMVRGVVR